MHFGKEAALQFLEIVKASSRKFPFLICLHAVRNIYTYRNLVI